MRKQRFAFAFWGLSTTTARAAGLAFTVFCAAAVFSPASALEPREEEAKLLSSCEEKLCRQILDKSPAQGTFRCDLGKTWGGDDINKGAKSKSMSWGFGDAQCSVDLRVSRQDIVKALTATKHEFTIHPHDVACTVQTSEGNRPLKARLAPKLKFEGGKAKKVWIKLEDIDGPEPLSSFVWTTAKLEDTIGIFHSEMIGQINKFIHQKCERLYGKKAMAKKRRKEAKLKRRARRKARQAKRARLRAERLKAAAEKADSAPAAETPARPSEDKVQANPR